MSGRFLKVDSIFRVGAVARALASRCHTHGGQPAAPRHPRNCATHRFGLQKSENGLRRRKKLNASRLAMQTAALMPNDVPRSFPEIAILRSTSVSLVCC